MSQQLRKRAITKPDRVEARVSREQKQILQYAADLLGPEEVIGDPPLSSSHQIETTLGRVSSTFATWRNVPMEERGRLMKGAAAQLRGHRDSLTRLMATEMGKPISAGEQEVEKCAWTCDYFADHAAAMLKTEDVATDASHSFIRYEPLGPVFLALEVLLQDESLSPPGLEMIQLLQRNLKEEARAVEDLLRFVESRLDGRSRKH